MGSGVRKVPVTDFRGVRTWHRSIAASMSANRSSADRLIPRSRRQAPAATGGHEGGLRRPRRPEHAWTDRSVTIESLRNSAAVRAQGVTQLDALHGCASPGSRTTKRNATPLKCTRAGSLRTRLSSVEVRGFEPLAFSLRTRRATSCAIPPRVLRNRSTGPVAR